MLRFIVIFHIILLGIHQNCNAQNLFQDPGFDEPIPKLGTITKCAGYTGKTFDKLSQVWRRSNEGSPDIVIPNTVQCPRQMPKELFTSPCLGIYLGSRRITNNGKSKEPIETTLIKKLIANKKYKLTFDILLNDKKYYQHESKPYRTSYINIVLKSSKTHKKDTLTVPIPSQSNEKWAKCSLVFMNDMEYDIIQFDYFSNLFFKSDHNTFIYAYLDNFSLAPTSNMLTKFRELDLASKTSLILSQYSYYFNSDSEALTGVENRRLISDIKKISLQEISRINIVGFTDNNHNIEYNNSLSVRRSNHILKSVQQILSNQSIKYNAEGKGVDQSKKHQTEARRVDVFVTYKNAEVAPWYQTSNNEQYAFNYSFLGNVKLSQQKNNVKTSNRFPSGIPPQFENLPFDAEKMILTIAKKSKILIINESHTTPSHRAFIGNLLSKLKTLGYNKLAVEALQVDDEEHSLTMKDPVFLRYLLTSKNLGYDLISYDNKSLVEPNWEEEIEQDEGIVYAEGYENIAKEMNLRDYNQFLNLAKHINELGENEKIIIHVGHGHGSLSQIGDWKPLGAYLIQNYGKESVVSIDQVMLNNCISRDSNDYYNKYKPTQSIVCKSNNRPYLAKEFNPLSMSYESMTDIQVLHPHNRILLTTDTTIIYVKHDLLEKVIYPLAIMIYQLDANPKTDIAYSAIEVKHQEDLQPSIIPNDNKYKMLIKDSKNQVIVYDINGM